MNFYLVFDHYYSGIIQSQVIDVVEFLEEETGEKFTILAFVNAKRYREARAKYKNHASRVIVLPNFGFSRWVWSIPFLVLFTLLKRPKTVIGRSVFANQLALKLKSLGLTKEVVLDARGAEFAEWSEYFFKQSKGPVSNQEIKRLEKSSVEKSDRLLAVSSRLIDYWKEVLSAKVDQSKVTIIPSTLSSVFMESNCQPEVISDTRKSLGIHPRDILIVFSGSDSDWHAFDRVLQFCDGLAQKNSTYRFLFLTNSEIDKSKYHHLSAKLHKLWLKPKNVPKYLAASDYALLLRDDSWTNFVSSPVKFAEYLASGCKVLISDNIGDFSKMVCTNDLGGLIVKWKFDRPLVRVSWSEKSMLIDFAKQNFSKKMYLAPYLEAYFGG